eukprot:1056409-Alexandrium_andersonii.AAC.1
MSIWDALAAACPGVLFKSVGRACAQHADCLWAFRGEGRGLANDHMFCYSLPKSYPSAFPYV